MMGVIPNLILFFSIRKISKGHQKNTSVLTECALAPSVSVVFSNRILSPLWRVVRFAHEIVKVDLQASWRMVDHMLRLCHAHLKSFEPSHANNCQCQGCINGHLRTSIKKYYKCSRVRCNKTYMSINQATHSPCSVPFPLNICRCTCEPTHSSSQ